MTNTNSIQPIIENKKKMSELQKYLKKKKKRHCRMQTSTTPLHKPHNLQQNVFIVGLIAVGLMISSPIIIKER
jgi:hypothetical protein